MPPMKGGGASTPSGSGRAEGARGRGRAPKPAEDKTVDDVLVVAANEGGSLPRSKAGADGAGGA